MASTTTLSVDSCRQQMIAALEAGERYRYLALADAYLGACPDDHQVRLFAVREYLKLGLVLPAKELLATVASNSGCPSELLSIRESLTRMPGGLVSWSDHRDRFEANLAALSGRGIDTTPIRDAWSLRRMKFQLYRDSGGVDQVRMRGDDGRWRWIPQIQDHPQVDGARSLPEGCQSDIPSPVLFEGLDLGWYFQRVYETTRDTYLGFSCALFVVEPDPACLALVFHLHDWRELLADSRVLLYFGAGCTERLRVAWENDPDLPFPRHGYTQSAFRPGCDPPAVAVVEQAGAIRERELAQSSRELEAKYASRDMAHWARRFDEALSGRGRPLRVLAAVSVHTTFLQHSMRDIKRALESLGHECMVLMERSNHHVIGTLTYHAAMREFDPDLFLSIDHLRPEFGEIVPSNLPVLTWDQDLLPQVFTDKNMRLVPRQDFLVGCAKPNWVKAGLNPRQFLHARVPTCPEQFGGDPLTEAEQARYACDVSYVSHASQTPKAFHEEERSLYSDSNVLRLLDAVYDLLPDVTARYHVPTGHIFVDVLEEAARRCRVEVEDGPLRERLLWWYMWRLNDRVFRHNALDWVARWARSNGRSFRIYGNGWENHPTLSEFAAGPADNGRELLCIYRASKINLQLMPAGFIHQRALDGLASGGFFLTRFIPQDVRGRVLRRLQARMSELNIDDPHALACCEDEHIRSLRHEFLRGWSERSLQDPVGLWGLIQISGELEFPDEVFPHYEEILFDSPQRFAEVADRFVADEALRRDRAEGMRQVVLERFSYAPMVNRFLHAMADYLLGAS